MSSLFLRILLTLWTRGKSSNSIDPYYPWWHPSICRDKAKILLCVIDLWNDRKRLRNESRPHEIRSRREMPLVFCCGTVQWKETLTIVSAVIPLDFSSSSRKEHNESPKTWQRNIHEPKWFFFCTCRYCSEENYVRMNAYLTYGHHQRHHPSVIKNNKAAHLCV